MYGSRLRVYRVGSSIHAGGGGGKLVHSNPEGGYAKQKALTVPHYSIVVLLERTWCPSIWCCSNEGARFRESDSRARPHTRTQTLEVLVRASPQDRL